jgi:hypothetical protein
LAERSKAVHLQKELYQSNVLLQLAPSPPRKTTHQRRTVREMASSLPKIEKNDLRSGDLVFFNTNGGRYSDVGLLVKDDDFIHAPSRRTGKVLVSSLHNSYWRKHFTGVRRPRATSYSNHLKLGQNSWAINRR